MSRKIGLFVGINEYVNDKTVSLHYAVKDASSMADVFKKSGYETYLLLDEQATAHNLQHTLAQITTNLSPGDMFLFYFSGHGAEFERKHLLICSNFDPNMYSAGTLTLNKVNQLTRKEGIERLFIIDSCRVKWDNDNEKSFTINGKKKEFYQYISDVYTKETQETGVIYNSVAEPIILTSCSSGETSVELTVGGHGFFTRHLLNILLSNTTYLTYRGLVLGLANSIGNTGQHPFETKPLNANPLIFGDKYSSGGDYCNKPGCLLGGLGFLSNVAASDLKKTSACDDPILIRKLKQGEKCEADEKKRIYNVKDSDGVFITSHIAECDVNSRKYNKLDGSNFYVSAMSFPIEINANLQHKDCPGGIQVRTSLLVKLHPGFSSFGEWVTRTVSDKITLSELTRLLQDKAYGLNLYLQKIIDGVNSFGLVSRYGREAVAWTGQDEALPEWLEIKNVQYLDAKALPTIVEQQRDAFNKKQQSLQQDIAERQQSLDYYIKVTEIDQVREEIAARNKILKEERERNIIVAQLETQIEVMKNNLKLQELNAEARFLDAKLDHDIKMCELDIEKKEEELQSIRDARKNSTALNAAKIRKIDAEIIGMGPKATTIKTLIITGIVSIAVILVVLAIVYSVLRFVIFPSLPIAQQCEKIKTRLSTYAALHYDYGKSAAALNELNAQFKSIQKFADHHIWVPGLDGKIATLCQNMDTFEKKHYKSAKEINPEFILQKEQIEKIEFRLPNNADENHPLHSVIVEYIDKAEAEKDKVITELDKHNYVEAAALYEHNLRRIEFLKNLDDLLADDKKMQIYKQYRPSEIYEYLKNDIQAFGYSLSDETNKQFDAQLEKYKSTCSGMVGQISRIKALMSDEEYNRVSWLCEENLKKFQSQNTDDYLFLKYMKKNAKRHSRGYGRLEDVINDLKEDLKEIPPFHKEKDSSILRSPEVLAEKYLGPVREEDLSILRDLTVQDLEDHPEKNKIEGISYIKASIAIQNSSLLMHLLQTSDSFPNKIRTLKDDAGNSLLHFAVRYSNYDIADFLLKEIDVDVNATNNDGQTPLMLAACQGDIHLLELLCTHNAKVNVICSKGRSALAYALYSQNPVETTEFLLSKGADVNYSYKIDDNTTATFFVLFIAECENISESDRLKLLELFLSHKLAVNKPCLDEGGGVYPLHCVAKLNLLKEAELLLKHDDDASVNGYGIMPNPPLLHALVYGHYDMIKLLLDKGANINQLYCVWTGAWPLYFLALDSPSLVKLLREKINIEDSHFVYKGRKVPLLEFLVTPLSPSIKLDGAAQEELLKILLSKGANIRDMNSDGIPAYFTIALANWSLFENNILPSCTLDDLNWQDHNKQTLLMRLCMQKKLNAVKKLLSMGVDPNIHDGENTVLGYAAKVGDLNFCKSLIDDYKIKATSNDMLCYAQLLQKNGDSENTKKITEDLKSKSYLPAMVWERTPSHEIDELFSQVLKPGKKIHIQDCDYTTNLLIGEYYTHKRDFENAIKYLEKTGPHRNYNLFKLYTANGDKTKAFECLYKYCQQKVSWEPDKIYYQLGKLFETGEGCPVNRQMALLCYFEALNAAPKDPDIVKAYNNIGRKYQNFSLEKLQDILDEYKEFSLEKQHSIHERKYYRTVLQYDRKYYRDDKVIKDLSSIPIAAEFFRKMAANKGGNLNLKVYKTIIANCCLRIAESYRALGMAELAIRYYHECFSVEPTGKTREDAMIGLARSYNISAPVSKIYANEYATYLLKLTVEHLQSAEAMFELAKYYEMGYPVECNGDPDFTKAEEWYKRAVDKCISSGDSDTIHHIIALWHADKDNEFLKTSRLWPVILNHNHVSRLSSDCLLFLAKLFESKQMYENAKSCYEIILRRNPTHAKAKRMLSILSL